MTIIRPRRFRVVWGLGMGLVAAVLLLAGGLHALQTASVIAALPVSVVLLFMMYGLLKSLSQERATSGVGVIGAGLPYPRAETPPETVNTSPVI